MKINDIITEDAVATSTASGDIANVSFPMTPGTSKSQARQAVGLGKKKKKKSNEDGTYGNLIRRVYPNE